MKIWTMDSGLKNMEVNALSDDFLQDFYRNPNQEWGLIDMEVIKKGRYSDFIYLAGGIPVFNDKSVELTRSMLAEDVEFLNARIINHDMQVYVLNVNTIDVVDFERSIPIYTLRGSINGFKDLYFIEEKVSGHHMFKIKEKIATVFVSDEFKKLIEASKLKGFEFQEVWDSEWTSEMEQQAQRKYEMFLTDLENRKGPEIDWNQTTQGLEQGKAFASRDWKIQYDKSGVLQIGRLTLDCEYSWRESPFVPPVLFDMKWHEVEPSPI